MNQEKLAKLQKNVRIGGKGTVRRKHKAVHKKASAGEQKLQTTLKKLGVNPIGGIEEVNLFQDNGKVIHFQNPKVSASVQANTYVVSGTAEEKELQELLPGILNQLGPDALQNLKKLAESFAKNNPDIGDDAPALEPVGDDDVPPLENAPADDVPDRKSVV